MAAIIRPPAARGAAAWRGIAGWRLPRREAAPLLLVALLTLIGAALRRYHLGQQSLWFDEADLVMRAREPLGNLLANFVRPGENGPLYTLGFALWLKLFGTSEVAVRLPAAIAGTLAIPALYGLGRALRGPRLGVIAAALITVSPYAHWYAQDAKMYSLLVLEVIAATWLLLVAVRRGGRWWTGYGALVAVSLLTHAAFALALVAHLVVVALLWRAGSGARPRGVQARVLLVVVGAAAAPLVVWAVLFAIGNVPTWQVAATPQAILRRMLIEFSATHRADPMIQAWAAWLSGALAAVGIVACLIPVPPGREAPSPSPVARSAQPVRAAMERGGERGWLPPRVVLLVVGGMAAIPGALFLLLSLRQAVFEDRYLIVTLPGFLLLVALGVEGLLRWRRAWPVALVAGAALLWLAWLPLRDVNLSTTAWKEDWRAAYRTLAARARAGDGVIISPGYLRTTYDYYALRFPALRGLPVVTPPPLGAETNVSDRELNAFFQNKTRGWERAWLVTSPERVATQDPQGRVRGFYEQGIPSVGQRPQTRFGEQKFNGVTLTTYAYNGPFQSDRLPPQRDVDVFFGETGIGLLGAGLQLRDGCNPRYTVCAVARGAFVPLLLRWIAPATPPPEEYTVLVRLVDARGVEVGRYDIPPLDGNWPTTEWRAKDDPYDPHDLFIPPDLAPGTYTIRIGIAPRRDPSRPLPVYGRDGARADTDGLIPLMEIAVR